MIFIMFNKNILDIFREIIRYHLSDLIKKVQKKKIKAEKKRLKTLAFQEEAPGAHFSWSGVASGPQNGALGGYE